MAIDYSSVINNATAQYNTALKGYQAQLAANQQQQQGVVNGYNSLQAGVLGGLEESSAVAGKQLSDQYKQQGAQQQMQLFRQGLGNSTTRNNLQNQLNQSSAFAQNDRMAKYATIAADKRTQLGLAGLNYAGGALRDNMQFAGQGLQYAGEGAFKLGGLAEGFAGMENQRAMQDASLASQKSLQDAQFAQQIKMQRLNQLYGTGGGGGGHIGFDNHPVGAQMSNRDNTASPYSAPWLNPNQPVAIPRSGAGGGGYGPDGTQEWAYNGTPEGWNDYTYGTTQGGEAGLGDGWQYEGVDYA